jgi:undecaprenyl-phosphate 4-deoxy-4-formamido-L-arabinose transferase
LKANGISVVVPVYNSHQTLGELVERLKKVFEEISVKFEVILINDGSKDSSWDVICELADNNQSVKGVNLMRNYGQHNALLAGIRMAKHEIILTIDDDLQHPPEEIPKLLEKLNEGHDVVYGAAEEFRHTFLRNIASQMTKLAFQSIMNIQVARKISAFRVFKTSLRTAFENYSGDRPSIDVLLSWATTNFSFVQVEHNEREAGESNYTFRKLAGHALNMMTGFSTMPLRIASLLGFCFTLFGIGIFLFVFVRYMLYDIPVQGFTFLASIIAIFSGVQLFVFGIFGEYLARMYSRTMNRPTYIVEDIKQNRTDVNNV